jgi:putative nucleotidyltransferase with HDIG domain
VTSPLRVQALLLGTVGAGIGVVAVAVAHSRNSSAAALALLAAGVVTAEVFQVPGDEKALRPVERQGFSLSFAVVGAAALILGPWQATLVAPLGVLVVDSLHDRPARKIAFNASLFALMGFAGGWAFVELGGRPGALDLPGDFAAVVGMLVAAYGVETLLLGSIIAFDSGVPLWRHQREKLRGELPVATSEAALALVLATLARTSPWTIVAVVPLMFAVYHSKAGYTSLRRETEHALETLANIVDERDSSTFRHSARVAEHVRALAAALGLPPADVQRLRWAGRLHDLGKIRVDGAVLRKVGPLDDEEFESIRLHPRLSARLLRRFRLAIPEAKAVEYHHERVDGAGYYNVRAEDIPLAAHLIMVADAYDAMTSDRPYRDGLPHHVALARIEAALGTQFDPVVGKAFLALQRGQDPLAVLSAAEHASLRELVRRTWSPPRRPLRSLLPSPFSCAVGGVIAAFTAAALGRSPLAAAGAVVALGGLVVHLRASIRARTLDESLQALAADRPPDAFDRMVDRFVAEGPLTWAAFVSWSDRSLDARIEREWRTATPPPTIESVTSWLIRELESRDDVLVADGADLGRGGRLLAVVLRRGGAPVGALVLGFNRAPADHVRRALAAAREPLTALFADEEDDFQRDLDSALHLAAVPR